MASLITLAALMNENILVQQLLNFTKDYFSDSRSITIISNDLSKWAGVNYGLPVVIKSFRYNFVNDTPASGVIIDSSGEDAKHILNGFTSDANTKYIVVKNGNCSSNLVSYLWKKKVCRLFYMSVINGQIFVCKDERGTCYLKEPRLTPKKLTNLQRVINYQLIPQLKNCNMNVSFMDFPPAAVKVNESFIMGYEGSIFHAMLLKLGSTVSYRNRHETEFGGYYPATGILGDVFTGRSLIGFGSLYPFAERIVKLDMLPMCTGAELAWAVPGGSGPHHPTFLIILVSEFSATVWLCAFISFILLVLLFVLSSKRFHQGFWFFHILALTLGIPENVTHKRILTIICLVYGYVITSSYKAMMSSKLTLPNTAPEIKTLRELVNSKISLKGPVQSGALIEGLSANWKDNTMKELSDKFQATTCDAKSIIKQMVSERNVAFARHKTNMIHISLQNSVTARKIHIVDEPLIAYLPGSIVPKHSCFTHRLRMIHLKLCEGGFAIKGYDDALKTQITGREGSLKKLSINDLKGSFYIVASGWLISLIAFFCEILSARVSLVGKRSSY